MAIVFTIIGIGLAIAGFIALRTLIKDGFKTN